MVEAAPAVEETVPVEAVVEAAPAEAVHVVEEAAPVAVEEAAPAAADSEDYSSEDERQQAQRRRQKQRQKDRAAKGKSRKSDGGGGAGESAKLVAPAAGLGGQGEEEWSQWASAELEQQLLDEVHTTGEARLPALTPSLCCCLGSRIAQATTSGQKHRLANQTAMHEMAPVACLPACFPPWPAGFAASCKTVFVMGLLKQLVPDGHRTLIFSQSRVM